MCTTYRSGACEDQERASDTQGQSYNYVLLSACCDPESSERTAGAHNHGAIAKAPTDHSYSSWYNVDIFHKSVWWKAFTLKAFCSSDIQHMKTG